MVNRFQEVISKDVAEKLYDLVAKPDDKVNPESLYDEEIISRLHTIKMSLI